MTTAGSVLNSLRPVLLATASVAIMLPVSGCGMFGDGLSDFERLQNSKESSLDGLKEKGAKFEQKTYPQGTAWSVDLTDMEISDETLDLLRNAGHLSELNFSGSSITDDQLAELDDVNLTGVLLKLDLSKTGITDAGIAEMKHFGFLRELNLTGTKVTAAAIESFKQARKENAAIIPAMKNVTIVQ